MPKLTAEGLHACSLPGCRQESLYVARSGNPEFRELRRRLRLALGKEIFRACGWPHYDVMSEHLTSRTRTVGSEEAKDEYA